MKKLIVQLVTWNGATYISDLFASLRAQTFTDWKLVVLDNDSKDETVKHIQHEMKNFPVEVELIQHDTNLGFAGGHNFLNAKCRMQNAEYVLLLNQDMFLMPDCFLNMVRFMDEHADVGAVTPRLMKWNFVEGRGKGVAGRGFTNIIDSLGLNVFRNRRVTELHAEEDWQTCKLANLQTKQLEVFGVSGAFPMYRSSVLTEVSFQDGTFLDESYGSYKEDVDLAFRLRIAGYKAFVLLDTVAYHDRSAAGMQDLRDQAASKNKKKQSEWVKYHSYKNHLMTIYKNEYWQNYLLDFFPIIWYELKKFVWFVLFDRKVLKGLKDVWGKRHEIKNKKMEIKNMRKVDWREMRTWWKH